MRPNGLACSTAALSLGVLLHRCDSKRCPIAVDWMDPHYMLLLFQSLSESGHDSQTCRGSFNHGQQVFPWGLPCAGPWQEKSGSFADFPPTPPVGHLRQLARHQVSDPALLLLRSLQRDLTPGGIYKELLSKGVLETRHSAAATLHLHVKMAVVLLKGGKCWSIQASGAVWARRQQMFYMLVGWEVSSDS